MTDTIESSNEFLLRRLKKTQADLALAIEGLRHLNNEIKGIVGIEEYSLREIVGNTNVECLKLRISEANEILAQLDKKDGE